MNLILDFGNTRLKAFIFNEDVIVKEGELEHISSKAVFDFLGELSPKAVILGSSVSIPGNFEYDLESFFQVLVLNENTKLPIDNKYATPSTLGYDRMAAAIGGWQLFKGSPVLSIVAGTCITYNIVDKNEAFIGGAISPGLQMRNHAMNQYTQKLPEIKLDGELLWTGNTTESSLRSGIINGTCAEIEGMIKRYETEYAGLKTVLTGGDAPLLAKALKNGIFARPNLVAEGLNTILEFNVKNDLL